MAKTSGCALSGFVLAKKVPGTLHVLAKSPGHSFDHQTMNLSHVVNYMYFGTKPSPRWRKVYQVLPPPTPPTALSACCMLIAPARCSGGKP